MKRRFVCTFTAILFFSLLSCIGLKKNAFARSLSFNTSYITAGGKLAWFNNNEGMSLFFEELSMGHAYAFDQISTSGWGKKNASFLLLMDLPLNLWLQMASIGTFHEFGRFSRARAFGVKEPTFSHSNSARTYKDPFSYYASFLFTRPFCMTGSTDIKMTPNIYTATAGANNAMLLAQNLSGQIDQGNGHITDLVPYFLGKTHSLFESSDKKTGNSLGDALDLYRARDIHISKGRVNTAALLSFFLSASTYSYIKGVYDFHQSGKTSVEPLSFYGFKAPDVNVFLLERGLSYAITSAYDYDDTLSFPFEVEFVECGEKGKAEYTIGVSKTFTGFYDIALEGAISYGPSGFGWAIDCTIPLGKKFFIQAHVEPMNILGHYGQRHVSEITKPQNINSYMIRFGMNY